MMKAQVCLGLLGHTNTYLLKRAGTTEGQHVPWLAKQQDPGGKHSNLEMTNSRESVASTIFHA